MKLNTAERSIIFLVSAIILIGIFFYIYNRNRRVKGTADPGEYSLTDRYKNIPPMKHDIFKQLTIDILIPLSIYMIIEVIGGIDTFFKLRDFISFSNFRDFHLSIIGRSLLTLIGYVVYYQILQPYFVNVLPSF